MDTQVRTLIQAAHDDSDKVDKFEIAERTLLSLIEKDA